MDRSPTAGVPVRVSDQAFAGDEPLVAVDRGDYVGSLHRGTVAVSEPSGRVVLALGDPQQPAYLRSAAKPFQIMPAVVNGGVERFGLTEREFAVLCASHSAEPRHMEAVLSVLAKLGLPESALQCGVHPPIDPDTAAAMVREGIGPSPVCNNCSGAHAGMLLSCRTMGWPLDGYGDPDHPLQREIRRILGQFVDLPAESVRFAIDNCAVPTFLVPLNRAATAFARLASASNLPTDLSGAAHRVFSAMTAYPEMIGGEDSFDTMLMRSAAGSMVAKGGAEGFQGIGIPTAGLGIAIKITDGESRAIPPVVIRVLDHLGVLEPEARAALIPLETQEIINLRDVPVGRLRPLFELRGRA